MAGRMKLFWAINGEKVLLILAILALIYNGFEIHRAGQHSAENNRILIERESFIEKVNRDHEELIRRCGG